MRGEELLFIKVFPSEGPVFYVGVPETVEDIDMFIEDHLRNVEFWEEAE